MTNGELRMMNDEVLGVPYLTIGEADDKKIPHPGGGAGFETQDSKGQRPYGVIAGIIEKRAEAKSASRFVSCDERLRSVRPC